MKKLILISLIILGLQINLQSQRKKSNPVESLAWTTYTVSDGLVDNNILAMAVDLKGNIWFGTPKGVSKFDGSNWVNYNMTNSGLVHNLVNSISIDIDGSIWFGTPGKGISKFDGKNWTSFTRLNGLICDTVFSIAIDTIGNKWFGTWGGGVSMFDGKKWVSYDDIANLQGRAIGYDNIQVISIDKQGNKWFGTSHTGVIKFDGANWTKFIKDNGVISIASVTNAIWFGTDEGAVYFDDNKWVTYTPVYVKTQLKSQNKSEWVYYDTPDKMAGNKYISGNGISGNSITSIAVDEKGNIWFGTGNQRNGTFAVGVSKFDGVVWEYYSKANGLVSNLVSAIAIDKHGNKWFGTKNGVSKYTGQ